MENTSVTDAPHWPTVDSTNASTVHGAEAPIPRLDRRERANRPTVPSNAEEWNSKKDIIRELYITRNIRVQDVAEIMATVYKFKATPRMYKHRFAKWKWTKYNNASLGVAVRKGESYGVIARQARNGTSTDDDPGDSHMTRLPFINDDVHDMNSVLNTWKSYICGWSTDARWQTKSKFDCLGSSSSHGQLAYINQDFRGAMEHFRSNDLAIGGRLLRYGFLRLEEVLLTDHVECLWVACVQIPQMILDAGYKDILLLFIKHMAHITRLRMPDHPLRTVAALLRALAERDAPQLKFYIESAGNVWVDTFADLRGRDDMVTLALKRSFMYVVPPSQKAIDDYLDDMESLARQAAAEFGEEHVLPIGKEAAALYTRWKYDRISEDKIARCEVLLDQLDATMALGVAADEPGAHSVGSTYQRFYVLLTLLPFYFGDSEKFEKGKKMFLSGEARKKDRNMWLAMTLEMETYFRSIGQLRYADEMKMARLKEQVPKNIAKVLDEQEKQAQSVSPQAEEDEGSDSN